MAKNKARHFAEMSWVNESKCIKEATIFWTSKSCDLCLGAIPFFNGYLFYSTTVIKIKGKEEMTGLQLLCKTCTNQLITDKIFASAILDEFHLTSEEVNSNIESSYSTIRKANAAGIIQSCKWVGLKPVQAKLKARRLGEFLWKNNQQAKSQAIQFWTTQLSTKKWWKFW